jgi:hypothetical protein
MRAFAARPSVRQRAPAAAFRFLEAGGGNAVPPSRPLPFAPRTLQQTRRFKPMESGVEVGLAQSALCAVNRAKPLPDGMARKVALPEGADGWPA